MSSENTKRKITIGDVEEALNLLKTNISHAHSGNERVPEKVRQRVIKYCDAHDYRPNKIAQSLALSKIYNLGWIIPNT